MPPFADSQWSSGPAAAESGSITQADMLRFDGELSAALGRVLPGKAASQQQMVPPQP